MVTSRRVIAALAAGALATAGIGGGLALAAGQKTGEAMKHEGKKSGAAMKDEAKTGEAMKHEAGAAMQESTSAGASFTG